MRILKSIVAIIVLFLLMAGCLGHRMFPSPEPIHLRRARESAAKEHKVNLEMIPDAEQFSKSLAFLHLILSGSPVIFDSHYDVKTEALSARLNAINESQNDPLACAIYLEYYVPSYGYFIKPDYLIDIIDAYEKQGRPDLASKFREHYFTWASKSGLPYVKAEGLIESAKYLSQTGNKEKSIENLEKAVNLFSFFEHKNVRPDIFKKAASLSIELNQKEPLIKSLTLLFEIYRYQDEYPFQEIFSQLESDSEFDVVLLAINDMDYLMISDIEARSTILTALVDTLRKRQTDPSLKTHIDQIAQVAKKSPLNDDMALILLNLASDYVKFDQPDSATRLIDYVFGSKASGRHLSVLRINPLEALLALLKTGKSDLTLELNHQVYDDSYGKINNLEELAGKALRMSAHYAMDADYKRMNPILRESVDYSLKPDYTTKKLFPYYVFLAAGYYRAGNQKKAGENLSLAYASLKELGFEIDKTSETVSINDLTSVSDKFTLILVGYLIRTGELDTALEILPGFTDQHTKSKYLSQLVEAYAQVGNYQKAISLVNTIQDSNDVSYERDRIKLKQIIAVKASEKGAFDVAFDLLWPDDEIIPEPRILSDSIIAYLKYNKLTPADLEKFSDKIFPRNMRMEYQRSLCGLKDFDFAQDAERNFDRYIDYISAKETIRGIDRQHFIPTAIPEKQLTEPENLFASGNYDECFESIKKTNESGWGPKFGGGSLTSCNYLFDDFPAKFASVKRFDLAIKSLKYVKPNSIHLATQKINEIIKESGYKLTDDDWFELRRIIHTDFYFIKYPYREKPSS